MLSEAKIKQATNNFEHRIGYGGFSDVFYGKLEDGQEIAAKVLSSGSHQSKEDFYNEVGRQAFVGQSENLNLCSLCRFWFFELVLQSLAFRWLQ